MRLSPFSKYWLAIKSDIMTNDQIQFCDVEGDESLKHNVLNTVSFSHERI